jgi:hypothetical protein
LRVALVEVAGCIFDAGQLGLAHGYEGLDPVGREAFVNHLHLADDDREAAATRVIESWAGEMSSGWPDREFRIYRQVEAGEVTIRFHMVRPGLPDWCEEGVEVIIVGSQEAKPEAAPDRGGIS